MGFTTAHIKDNSESRMCEQKRQLCVLWLIAG